MRTEWSLDLARETQTGGTAEALYEKKCSSGFANVPLQRQHDILQRAKDRCVVGPSWPGPSLPKIGMLGPTAYAGSLAWSNTLVAATRLRVPAKGFTLACSFWHKAVTPRDELSLAHGHPSPSKALGGTGRTLFNKVQSMFRCHSGSKSISCRA
jgi:hypothetical protein